MDFTSPLPPCFATPWCQGCELPQSVTALQDWSPQRPAHQGTVGQEMWWQSGGSAVLTAPLSLAVGDSNMNPLCLLHLPTLPAWGLILTEPVLTPKRKKDGAIKCWMGEGSQAWTGSWVFLVSVSESLTIMSLGQVSNVRSWGSRSVCILGQGNRYGEQWLVKVLGLKNKA